MAASYLNFYICNGAVIVPVTGADTDPEALAIIAAAYPRPRGGPGARRRAGLRRRRPALHHPAGAGARCLSAPLLRPPPPPPRRRARGRPSARRCGSAWSRSAGTPTPTSIRRRWRAASGWPPAQGAKIVCLQELTLSPYFAITPDGPQAAGAEPEDLETGPTVPFARRMAAATGVHVHASLYERAERPAPDGLGYNTAVVVAPDGELVSRTRKLHIPVTAGYYEDHYFRPGPGGTGRRSRSPSCPPTAARSQLGCPTCWDQWFPELARAYSLEGAEVLIYPTAIGSEPDHPDFDTQPLWQQVIVGNGIANGTFMVAVNRIGVEPPADLLRLELHLRPLRAGARPGPA